MFASMLPTFGESLVIMILFFAVVFHFVKKYGEDNPEVKEVVKKTVAQKIIELITKRFGK